MENIKKEEEGEIDELNLSENEKLLKKGWLHNKFAAYCLIAKDFEKGEKHLMLSIETLKKLTNSKNEKLEKINFFSNLYMNLGNVYAQKKDFDKALECYEWTIKISPFNPETKSFYDNIKNYYDLDKSLFLNDRINSFNAYVDAYSNLAVMYLIKQEYQKAFEFCQKALEINPNGHEAYVNFSDILRKIDKRDEGINFSWEVIEKTTNKSFPDKKYQIPKMIECSKFEKIKHDENKLTNVNVLFVKWGKKYDSEYVNKILRGILRNTVNFKDKISFYCFTDNKEGLDPMINIIPLKEEWNGWWGKATLFSSDMIIINNIDEILEYNGFFATLKTDEIDCEKSIGGYNSSIMIWNSKYQKELETIYLSLKENYDIIRKYIHRFDFWLEMMIKDADFLQDIYKNQIADFLFNDLKNDFENKKKIIKIVCFPRNPKPDDYPAEWIKEYWL